jgi:hypothetical protein
MLLFQKFLRISKEEKKYLLEATFYCILFKWMLLLIPIKKYSGKLGKQDIYTNFEPSIGQQEIIYQVSISIARSRKVIPWRSKCFAEAIAAKKMLKKKNIQSTLYLGVNKKEEKMTAHAWLRSGSIWITGKKGSGNYVVISTFT